MLVVAPYTDQASILNDLLQRSEIHHGWLLQAPRQFQVSPERVLLVLPHVHLQRPANGTLPNSCNALQPALDDNVLRRITSSRPCLVAFDPTEP
jgi:hypothetical protein